MQKAFRTLILSLGLLVLSGTYMTAQQKYTRTQQTNAPPQLPLIVPLEELKTKAEAGDPYAQDKLGDAYRGFANWQNAILWYRKAAQEGVANSQYQLAHILISPALGRRVPTEEAIANVDEAIPLLVKAANQDMDLAQVELGELYAAGRFIAKDWPEAYKWFSLAAERSNSRSGKHLGTSNRDRLVLKMSLEEIAEGKRRVAAFGVNSGNDVPMPVPNWVQKIRLEGISGTADRPLAIINGKTLAPGESAKVSVEGRSITVTCRSVKGTLVTVAIEGVVGDREMGL